MAIIIKGTGGIDTPSINATSNAVFTGPVDFTQAVLKGVNKWQVVSSDTNVQSNRNYFANTRSASLTLTLPTSANVGDTIVVQDVDRGGIALTFESATNGFVTKKEEREDQVLFQGTISGYASGGIAPPVFLNTIDKFPFVSDASATDVGDLSQFRFNAAGQSSSVSGYSSGGYAPPDSDVIDKFPFAVDSNATDVGNLTVARNAPAGQSSIISGYSTGGFLAVSDTFFTVIDKFPFATDTNATDVGDLSLIRANATGQSSTVSGYTSGGLSQPPPTGALTDTIDKFPFAVDTNATDVGNLTQARRLVSGQSSTVNGYTSGGYTPPTQSNIIDKFPFATDTNATDVGDLTQNRRSSAGQSSTVFGYASGGYAPTNVNTVDKFPFATDANATDVGDLTQARTGPTGQQV